MSRYTIFIDITVIRDDIVIVYIALLAIISNTNSTKNKAALSFIARPHNW